MSESQSCVTPKAQDMFQRTGNWSPDRTYADDLHDNRHNPQVPTCTHSLTAKMLIRSSHSHKIKPKTSALLCGTQVLVG